MLSKAEFDLKLAVEDLRNIYCKIGELTVNKEEIPNDLIVKAKGLSDVVYNLTNEVNKNEY